MGNKGVTLYELLIVIIVIGIITSFSIVAIGNIIENASAKVDQHNVEFLEDVLDTAYADGTIIVQNNKLYNTRTNRGYSGTGQWFYDDMDGYIENYIKPVIPDAQNEHNIDGGTGDVKLWFDVSGNDVSIFYWDNNKNKVVLHSFTLG